MLKAEIEGRSYSPPPPSAVPPPQRGGGGGGAGSRSPASSGSRNPSAGKNLDDWGNWDGDKVRWSTRGAVITVDLFIVCNITYTSCIGMISDTGGIFIRLPHCMQGGGNDGGGGFTSKSEYTRAQYEASAASKETFFAMKQAVSGFKREDCVLQVFPCMNVYKY